jgi:hypothetical protein
MPLPEAAAVLLLPLAAVLAVALPPQAASPSAIAPAKTTAITLFIFIFLHPPYLFFPLKCFPFKTVKSDLHRIINRPYHSNRLLDFSLVETLLHVNTIFRFVYFS